MLICCLASWVPSPVWVLVTVTPWPSLSVPGEPSRKSTGTCADDVPTRIGRSRQANWPGQVGAALVKVMLGAVPVMPPVPSLTSTATCLPALAFLKVRR